jgi:RND family efflux transporter MFP subunit
MRRSLIFISCFSALMATGCKKQEAATTGRPPEPPAVSAALIPVTAGSFQATVPVTGTLVSRSQVDVKAEVIGRITRFDKEEGDRVEAGEPVIFVNDENYQLALRQAEAAIAVAEAGLARAELARSHARSEMERAENLLKSGGITDKDLKAAQLADRDAGAQVLMAKAQLEQSRSALSVTQKHIRDTVIHAPVAGEIQRKIVNKGAYVEAPTHVFSIVDNGRLELESSVATSDLAPVRQGQRVNFTVNAYPGAAFEGRVIEIAPSVDEQTRSAKVRIQVDNSARKLKAGMFAQGEILTGVSSGAIIIPSSAVYRDDRSAKSSYVFVVENGAAARRGVRIGRERDSQLEIVEGLKPGDQVIAEQNIEIADGVRVQGRR